MKKNPNKAAGNWGALKTKPQNLVPFQVGGKVTVTAGDEKHVIYKKTTRRGEGKVGNVMVNHPTKDKGVWDTIDLTKKSGAKTIQQGVASTKKWHKENPYNDMKKQVTKKQTGGPSLIDKVKSNAKTIAKTPAPKGNVRFKIDNNKMFPDGGLSDTPYVVDTTGLAAGKKSFPYRYGSGTRSSGKIVNTMTDTAVKEVLERTKKTGNRKKMGGAKKYQAGGTTAADKVAEQRAINAKRKAEALARTEKAKTDARAKIDQAQKNKPVTKPAEPVAQTTAPVRRNPEDDWRPIAVPIRKAKIATKSDPYNYENKTITKNKINALGRNVRKTKADSYFVPGKMVTLDENDSEEMFRRKMGYLSDKSDQQKTGTQKTRTVTNPKKGTVKTVTRSKGSYLKDGEKKRTVTKTSMKTGGSIKKYQKGGASYIDKVKAVGPAIQKNTKTTDTFNRAERKEFMDQFSMDRLSSKGINYLNRKPTRVSGRAGSPYEKMSNEGMSVQEALRLAAKKGEQKKKFTPAYKFTPPKASSPKVVKQSLYNKKIGGSVKKYQAGGTQSTIEKARNIGAGIKANTKKKPTTPQDYRNYIAAAERSLLTPGRVDYLGDNRKQFPVKDAVRIAVGKGEQKKKFTRAPHPSDVLGKPKYLKKSGGSIKKKK